MNTKISMHRIFFMLYILLMILLTGINNINQIAILVCLFIGISLYFSKKLVFTYKVYTKVSLLFWLFFGILNGMPMGEEPSGKIYIGEYIIYGVLFLMFIALLYIDIKFNKKTVK